MSKDRQTPQQIDSIDLESAQVPPLEDVRRVIANLTHELKTPLHSILAVASVLASEFDGPLTEEQRRQVEIIVRNGEQLLELITGLLQYSSLSATPRLGVARVLIRDMFQGLVSSLQAVAENSGVKIEADFSKLAEHFHSDEAVLGRIFGNLLSNAVKFSPDGGVVQFFAETRSDGALRVEVADEGIGIPYELQQAVFEEFFQADAGDSRRFGGVGLGLTLVKTSVNLLKGSLELHSAPGQGTLFTVLIPDAANQMHTPQILVLLSDEVLQLTLRECFSLEGYQVTFATAAEGLMVELASRNWDLVMLDPFHNEEALAQSLSEIRQSPWGKDVPIILISSLDAPQERAQAFRLGVDDFLAKPFDAEELLARVRTQLGRRSR